MNEEEKDALIQVKHFNNITRYWQEEEYEEKEIKKYITTILNLIEKQDKIINEMADEMADIDYDYMCGNWCGNETGCDGEERATCIKKYFSKKVGE